jgi:Icc protein
LGQSSLTEFTTVAEDFVVIHKRKDSQSLPRIIQFRGLSEDTEFDLGNGRVRTLKKPDGLLLAKIATVNDLHIGETKCGVISGLDIGPILSNLPGEEPYPETMAKAAAGEIEMINPDIVVAKGDLTSEGTKEQFESFLKIFSKFENRFIYTLGNHDVFDSNDIVAKDVIERVLPGITVGILNTSRPEKENGYVSADQLEWLDELATRTKGPLIVMGHHHLWNPSSNARPENYFGIIPDDSEKLVEIMARNLNICCYLSGHTHRNRVRYFKELGDRPIVEVAAVKDFPGTWAEYRIYETGFTQIHHRIGTLSAIRWSERCRSLYGGKYVDYAFGDLEDRCYSVNFSWL